MKKKIIYSVISACVAALALVFGIILLVQALTPKISVKLESDYDDEALEMHVAVSVRSECKYDIKKCKILLGYYAKKDGDKIFRGTVYAKSNETVRVILPHYDINDSTGKVSTDVCYKINYIDVENASDIAVSIILMAIGCAATVIVVLLIVDMMKNKRNEKDDVLSFKEEK